jgi:tetratricopeptide (TPR) repeat protein
MAEVWGPERRASTEQALASAGPAFVTEIWPGVSGELDRYAGAWQHGHRDACQAHQRGENSDTLLDRRMACLAQRKAALREAVTVLAEGEAEVALHALEVVNSLPALDRCSDLAALEADVAPPADPEVRAAVEEVRPRLERIQALEHAGLQTAAVNLADEVLAAAEKIADRKLLAEALLQRGRLAINRLDHANGQDAVLTRAYLTALGGRLDEVATEALALRMYHRSRENGRAAQALDDLAVAREMVGRLPSPERVNGLVLNNAGTVYLASGDIPQATALFREALTAREAALGPEHLEVAYTLANLAMVSAIEDRTPLIERALRIFDRQLGQAHPQTLELRLATSYFTLDPRDARALITPGCEALGRFASDRTQHARCMLFLGHHAREAGDNKAAAESFLQLDRLFSLGGDAKMEMAPVEVAEIRGYAALYTGKHAEAVELLRTQLAVENADAEMWQRRHRAELEFLLGLHLDRLGKREEARSALTSAVTTFEAAATASPDVLLQQRLSGARSALAAHLLATRATSEDQEFATKLLSDAEQWYRGAGAGYAWRLDELSALRRKAALR